MDKEYDKFQVDLKKLKLVTDERESKVKKNKENTKTLEDHITKSGSYAFFGILVRCRYFEHPGSEIAALRAQLEDLHRRIAEQGLTAEEVAQMGADRDNLRRALEDIRPRAAEAFRMTGNLEIAVSKRADTVEQVVNRYITLGYSTGMIPNPPAPFEDINFKLELNTGVANPMDMLKADMRNEIHPALRQVADTKRRERAGVEDERIKTKDEFEELTQEWLTLEEETKRKDSQLRVQEKLTEELRDVCITCRDQHISDLTCDV